MSEVDLLGGAAFDWALECESDRLGRPLTLEELTKFVVRRKERQRVVQILDSLAREKCNLGLEEARFLGADEVANKAAGEGDVVHPSKFSVEEVGWDAMSVVQSEPRHRCLLALC